MNNNLNCFTLRLHESFQQKVIGGSYMICNVGGGNFNIISRVDFEPGSELEYLHNQVEQLTSERDNYINRLEALRSIIVGDEE